LRISEKDGIPEVPPGRYFVAIVTPEFLDRPGQSLRYTAAAEHTRHPTWPRRPNRYRDITVIDLAHRKHAYLHAPPVEDVGPRLRDVTKVLNGVLSAGSFRTSRSVRVVVTR
jgi:hypothetical protein